MTLNNILKKFPYSKLSKNQLLIFLVELTAKANSNRKNIGEDLEFNRKTIDENLDFMRKILNEEFHHKEEP